MIIDRGEKWVGETRNGSGVRALDRSHDGGLICRRKRDRQGWACSGGRGDLESYWMASGLEFSFGISLPFRLFCRCSGPSLLWPLMLPCPLSALESWAFVLVQGCDGVRFDVLEQG